MVQIEGRLKKLRGKSFKAGPPDKGGQQYRQWVEEFYKDAVAVGDRYLVTYTEHLREYHISLTLNSNTRMKNARSYLKKYFRSLDKEKFTDIDEILEKLFYKAMEALDKFIEKNDEPENPKLTKLKELLLENYQESRHSDNGQHKTNESREGDGNSQESANENGQEKVGSKEGAMNGDVEGSKMSDDKVTEATKRTGEVDRKAPGQEENARKDENKRENITLKTEQSAIDTTERSSPDTAVTQEQENSHEILCVNAANNAQEGSSSEVLSDPPDESKSKVLDDLKDDVTEGSSSDTANEDDKAEQTKSRHHPEWEGPKGILFTRTRESTEALMEWIKETEELNKVLRPVLLVGSGDGKSK